MITVVGEALVDLLIATDGTVRAALGGAPYNTARAAARLGAEVAFAGALSTDRFGTLLAGRLEADGVAIDRALRTDRPTTLAAVELDGHGSASYRFYIDGTSAPGLETVPDLSGDACFTGGLGLVLEPMATSIERALSTTGALVMVDVNCRPLIVPDRARYLARLGRVLAHTDVVKVSDDDLAYLDPGAEPHDAARSLLELGPSVVLLTAGAAGVHVLTPAGERHVPAVAAEVVDTVGAGDTFGAGFLVGWTESGDPHALDDLGRLVTAAELGARAAAIVVGRAGADPPRRDELG